MSLLWQCEILDRLRSEILRPRPMTRRGCPAGGRHPRDLEAARDWGLAARVPKSRAPREVPPESMSGPPSVKTCK
jgi:hypothetical protein